MVGEHRKLKGKKKRRSPGPGNVCLQTLGQIRPATNAFRFPSTLCSNSSKESRCLKLDPQMRGECKVEGFLTRGSLGRQEATCQEAEKEWHGKEQLSHPRTLPGFLHVHVREDAIYATLKSALSYEFAPLMAIKVKTQSPVG